MPRARLPTTSIRASRRSWGASASRSRNDRPGAPSGERASATLAPVNHPASSVGGTTSGSDYPQYRFSHLLLLHSVWPLGESLDDRLPRPSPTLLGRHLDADRWFLSVTRESRPVGVARSKGLSPDRQPRRASIFPGCSGFRIGRDGSPPGNWPTSC